MFIKSRKRSLILKILIALGIITVIGPVVTYSIMTAVMSILASDTQDVTALATFQGEDIWKSYKRAGIYQLKRDLLFGKLFDPGVDEYELFPPWAEPGYPHYTHYMEWHPKQKTVEVMPESIKAFNDDPKKWARIKGVVPTGTKLRMAHVVFRKTIDSHDFYYMAVFIDGPFAGKPVLLNTISKGDYGSIRRCDSEYLELVKKLVTSNCPNH